MENINKRIAHLKKEINDLENGKVEKKKGSLKRDLKLLGKAIIPSTKKVFGELGKATNQVFMGNQSVDDVIERLPK